MNEKIFKTYDIRGVYQDELTEEDAYKIGRGFATYAKDSQIIVGQDTRLSSSSLTKSLIKGIVDQGVDVIDIGLCSTGCLYYTTGDLKVGSGIMVTASHSSKEFNGFKLVFKNNIPLTKEQILELKEIIMKENFSEPLSIGKIERKNPTSAYIEKMKQSIVKEIKSLKVVMDAGNGMAGLYIEKVFSNIGIEVIPMLTELDGNFPNHETNPKIPENRIKLSEKIVSEGADLGFMFDGDADRLYILDRNGKVIDPSLILAIISEYMVKNSPNKKIVVEVRTSRIVKEWVERAGGTLEVSSAWSIPIKFKLIADKNVVFGGETSGHYIFPEMHNSDDGIFSALVFLQAISEKKESIDEIIKDFRENYFVLEETNFEMENMGKADEILKDLKNKYSEIGAQILEIDGLSVIFPNWWFNLRKSQSEPMIRLNLEADSKKLFDEKAKELIKYLKNN